MASLDPFGVIFPGHPLGLPIYSSAFQPGPTPGVSWLLPILEGHEAIREAVLFLTARALPPEKALALYVKAPRSAAWEYRGAVTAQRPSEVVPLSWPKLADSHAEAPSGMAAEEAAVAEIGIMVVDVVTLPGLNDGNQRRVVEMALRVGQNLFNFMLSFATVTDQFIHVPLNILDLWLAKLKEKARLDPDYLGRIMEI